jgi:hypothetical protein
MVDPTNWACLQPGKRGAALTHILARLVGVAGFTGLISLQEKELADPLVGMDLGRQWRGVADLDRHLAFPLGLQRRDVNDDAATGVGGFPQADDQDVARNAKIFDGVAERETVRGNDANVGLAVHEAGGLKGFGIDNRGINIGEDLELVRDAGVIAVAGQAVADHAVTLLRLDERLNHAVVLRHPADPAVGQDGHSVVDSGRGGYRCSSANARPAANVFAHA